MGVGIKANKLEGRYFWDPNTRTLVLFRLLVMGSSWLMLMLMLVVAGVVVGVGTALVMVYGVSGK